MIITELIREQVFQVTVMTCAGIAVMALHRIFRLVCCRLRLSVKTEAAAEILFWIPAAFIAYKYLYYCAFGEISFHAIGAFTIGVILWRILFCDIINHLWTNISKKQRVCGINGKKEKKQPIQRE